MKRSKRNILICLVLVAGYFALPIISNLVANMAWPSRPAPWENIIGLYYAEGPRSKGIESPHFSELQQCKNWITGMQALHSSMAGSKSAGAQAFCGWGILRFDTESSSVSMRDFITVE